MAEPPPASLAGRFYGATADGRPVELALVKTDLGVSGHGRLDGDSFAISLITAACGVGVVSRDGRALPVSAEISFDGEALTLQGLDAPVEARRSGGAEAPAPEGFSGRYRAAAGAGSLELFQSAELVVGTGFVYGRRFALSGSVGGDGRLRGSAVFADGSEAVMDGELDGRGRLILTGFGTPLTFRRTGRQP